MEQNKIVFIRSFGTCDVRLFLLFYYQMDE